MRLAIATTTADLVTFLVMLAVLGPAAEGNGLVRAAIAGGVGGLAAVVLAKFAIIVSLALWERACERYSRAVFTTAIVVGFIGAASNVRAVAG